MNHGTSKLSSWSKKLLGKWFNLNSRTECQGEDSGGGDSEWRNNSLKREASRLKKKKSSRSRNGRVDLDHPQIINVQNYSVFVATWNLGGRSPSSNMNLDDFIHSAPPADIYVLGFQEIVPLNAGNILGAEDNGPAKKWLSLLRRSLNDLPAGMNGGPPSPTPNPVAESDADFEGSINYKKSSFFPRRSYQEAPQRNHDESERRYSVCDRVMFGQQQSATTTTCDQVESTWGDRPSDYSSGRRMSDFSRWGSSDEDCNYKPNCEYDSPSTVLFSSPIMEDEYRTRQSKYCLVASKQMVGVFLTVWVRSELREHVTNIKVSCVGRGLMGYLGNKGSISISMLVHRTSFCFVCSHLTSGQKEGDELRRNADVSEILRKTRFPQVINMKAAGGDILMKSPETILEHDRIIWLGDLNYRIALSQRSAKALVEMQNWRGLLENDQLRIEQRHGRVFQGWEEGKIYFPPTYKYSYNSDRYSVDNQHVHHHPKQKQRTPAWCDRILWYGEGLHQLSYVRGESRFSDHRPVYGIFWAEAEYSVYQQHSRKSTSCSSSRIEAEDLFPYSNGYTELCFF
ncbi:type IV inositol polyphosphate 5-phosphatase 7-like isoform X2 [Impatiens glandulifera]|uniref:type IV inositol polyphosphate 5-phosphatase 7-like isoform X2 n=1 Tax=Impatiens glandulifera TaxID=253017 RepID=UPI001FB18230|nr:type IV inositol polyphosphate 5-phosphatase 7-like isoform X2 [Impatiens glandulifera]